MSNIRICNDGSPSVSILPFLRCPLTMEILFLKITLSINYWCLLFGFWEELSVRNCDISNGHLHKFWIECNCFCPTLGQNIYNMPNIYGHSCQAISSDSVHALSLVLIYRRWPAMRALRRRRLVCDIWERLWIISAMVGDHRRSNRRKQNSSFPAIILISSPIIADIRELGFNTGFMRGELLNDVWRYPYFLSKSFENFYCFEKYSNAWIPLKFSFTFF